MLFVATGGTIDKEPAFKDDGVTFDNDSRKFGETYLPAMLERIQFVGAHSIETAFMIDSLEMDDHDRARIVRVIADSDHGKVVVTHGTDTMAATADFLFRHQQQLMQRTIVLTGAMIPFSVDGIQQESDAVPNLTKAIGDARQRLPGVYVRIGNRIFDGNNVRKDTEQGVFKTLDEH